MRTARAHVLQQEEGVSARDPDAPCPLKLPLQLGTLRLRTVDAAHLDAELRAEKPPLLARLVPAPPPVSCAITAFCTSLTAASRSGLSVSRAASTPP